MIDKISDDRAAQIKCAVHGLGTLNEAELCRTLIELVYAAQHSGVDPDRAAGYFSGAAIAVLDRCISDPARLATSWRKFIDDCDSLLKERFVLYLDGALGNA